MGWAYLLGRIVSTNQIVDNVRVSDTLLDGSCIS
jgi:hypothetical protein